MSVAFFKHSRTRTNLMTHSSLIAALIRFVVQIEDVVQDPLGDGIPIEGADIDREYSRSFRFLPSYALFYRNSIATLTHHVNHRNCNTYPLLVFGTSWHRTHCVLPPHYPQSRASILSPFPHQKNAKINVRIFTQRQQAKEQSQKC